MRRGPTLVRTVLRPGEDLTGTSREKGKQKTLYVGKTDDSEGVVGAKLPQ